MDGKASPARRAVTWLSRLADVAEEVINDPFGAVLLALLALLLALLLASVPFGLAALGYQVFVWAGSGVWPDVSIAATITYATGLGSSHVYFQHPEVLANAVRWVLALPLWSVAVWFPIVFAIGVSYGFFSERSRQKMLFSETCGDAESFRRKAEAGIAWAQNDLGLMYLNGKGGAPKDYVKAHKWLNLGAASHPPGKQRDQSAWARDRLARRMTPQQIVEAQRLAREWPERHRTEGDDQ